MKHGSGKSKTPKINPYETYEGEFKNDKYSGYGKMN
jgi:MORN repeat